MIGQIIGNRYRIIKELGSGGMARVYLAEDVREDYRLALKVLYPQLAEDVTYIQRFVREAKLAMVLSDVHIVKVLDYGADRDTHFLAMEFIQGRTVKEYLDRQGSLPLEMVLDIAYQVTQALQDAHSHGIVHRDIKPHNLMVMEDGLVKVLDFGVARAQDLPSLTRSGFVGSPYYMAPEQAMGELVDVRSDIYSLGIVIYEMLSGKLPFAAETPWSIVSLHISTSPPPLSRFCPGILPEMEELVNKALAKRPEDRFQTPEELQRALLHVAAVANISLTVAPPTPEVQPTTPVIPEMPPSETPLPEKMSENTQSHLLAELYTAGQRAAEEGDWRRALHLHSQIVQIYPDYRDASARLAQAGREVNLIDLYQKAQIAVEGKRWDEAKKILGKLLNLAPDYKDAPALLVKVEDALKRKEDEDTIAGKRQAAAGEPTAKPRREWLRWAVIAGIVGLGLLCGTFFLSGGGAGLVAMLNPRPTATATNTATVEPTEVPSPTEVASATASPNPTEAASATTAPSPTEAAKATSTPSPTALPSHTPLPTETTTNTPFPTDTNTPKAGTSTPTSTPTPVATRPLVVPTATTTPGFKYDAPQIAAPVDKFATSGERFPPVLEWQPVGELAEDEYYSVTVFRPWHGQPYYAGSDWTKDTTFIPVAGIVRNTSDLNGEYTWWVTVVKHTGQRSDGGRAGIPISPESEQRKFYWH